MIQRCFLLAMLMACAPALAQVVSPAANKEEISAEMRKIIDGLKIEDLVSALQQHTRIDKTGQALARARAQTQKEVDEAERQVALYSRDQAVQKFIEFVKSAEGKKQLAAVAATPANGLPGALSDLLVKQGIAANPRGMVEVLKLVAILNNHKKAVTKGQDLLAKIDAKIEEREKSAEANDTPFQEPSVFNPGNDPLARLRDIEANLLNLPKDRKPAVEQQPSGADLQTLLKEALSSFN